MLSQPTVTKSFKVLYHILSKQQLYPNCSLIFRISDPADHKRIFLLQFTSFNSIKQRKLNCKFQKQTEPTNRKTKLCNKKDSIKMTEFETCAVLKASFNSIKQRKLNCKFQKQTEPTNRKTIANFISLKTSV